MEEKRTKISFSELALALANDYESIYVIDSEDDSYVEYSSEGAEKELIVRSSGEDFFADLEVNCREMVWPEDQNRFLRTLRKERLERMLGNNESFDLRYRLNIDGQPQYYYLKTIRMRSADVIIGVQNVDKRVREEMKEDRASAVFGEIARSLGSMFEVIYYIDAESGAYEEYSSSQSFSELGIANRGDDFFQSLQDDIEKHIYPDDRDMLLFELDKTNLLRTLRTSQSYSLVYRQVLDGRMQYVSLFATLRGDHVVIAVRNIDSQVRREESIAEENATFSEIATALAQRYEVIYRINIQTNAYDEFATAADYEWINGGKGGSDFFETSQRTMKREVYPDDYPMVSVALKKDHLLNNLKGNGKFFLSYRVLVDNEPQYFALFAVRPSEDSDHVIIAVANVDYAKRKELAFETALGNTVNMANRDVLTGLQNKRYFAQNEIRLDNLIWEKKGEAFSIVVCDINGLKKINESQGFKAGDQYILDAAQRIESVFEGCVVCRIGGDEFAVILEKEAYENRRKLIRKLSDTQSAQRVQGKVTVAFGMADFNPERDMRFQDVYELASKAMHVNKNSQRGLVPKLDSAAHESALKLSLDEKRLRFYELFIQLVSKMTDINGNIEANTPEIEKLLIDISSMNRLSKGVTRLFRNPQEEAMGRGESLCCYDTGIEGKEVLTLRVVTSVMSIATMTVYMAPGEPPLTDEEYWQVELVMRTTLSYVSRNRLKDIVYHLAYYDDNGYLNSRSYTSHIMRNREHMGGMVAVMYNLLHFSQVNRDLGRKNGDRVMKNHFEGMQKLVGEKGIVCRLGGDNFIALFGTERMGSVFAYLNNAFVVYDTVSGKSVAISTTVGVYRIPKDAVVRDPSDVLEFMMVAFGVAKHGGNDRVVFYDDSLLKARDDTMKVQHLFPEALKKEEFQVFYQPKVHTETGRVIGAEALCRWFHEGKMVSPGAFIPVLEETDDICKLDFYMLDHVCRDIRRWIDQGRKVVRISVNLSRKHMINRNLVEQLMKIIDRHNVPHSCIEIELTETTTDVAFSDLKRVVTGLQSAGIFASVDDFGIGYSSLNLIRELPWNVLKVDRSILPMEDDEPNSVNSIMFRYVIAMVNELGIECIVEGVETEKQLEILRMNNCHYAQGFLFDKPLPVAQFEERMSLGYYEI